MAAPVLVTGVLDPDFGEGGAVVTDFSAGFDTGLGVAVQSDGKIVAVGGSGNDFAVARYNPDGTLDTTFSGDGKIATDFAAGFEAARSVVIQSDGKILVVGDSIGSGSLLMARYNADGSLDTSFSGDGKVTTAGSGFNTAANDVALQSDGRIVIATGSTENFEAAVWRYNENGTLDTGFDGDGKLAIPVGTLAVVRAVTVQSDGKIVIAGYASPDEEDTDNNIMLVRLNADGTLDAEFGEAGIVLTPAGTGLAEAFDVLVDADGKIVVGGTSHNGNDQDHLVARYNSDGSLDTSFGEGGLVTTDLGGSETRTMLALQADGRIVGTGGFSGFSLLRYNADGTLDESFDEDGNWVVTVGEAGSSGWAVAVLEDGGLVAVGQAQGTNTDFALIRTLPEGIPDHATDQDAPIDLDITAYFGDPDDDPLTYAATLEGGDPLPEWLSIDSITGAFGGTPTSAELGTIEVEVTASDGSESVSDVFTLTVATSAGVETGTAGNDTLDAGPGADTMIGLGGDDIYFVDNEDDVIVEATGSAGGDDEARSSVSYLLPSNVEDLFLTGDAAIDGTGNILANLIVGNSSGNRLNGGGAIDDLRGGDGSDTYVVDNFNDQVVEEEGEGEADTVQSTVTFTLSDYVENLALMGAAAISGTGNDLANVLAGNNAANGLAGMEGNDSLVGGNGNDTLDGGAGSDTMVGGIGNDTYIVDNAGDVVIETSGQGTDVVYSSVTRALGDHQENLVLTGPSAINGTGNTLSNQLIGNNGNNVLTGLAGDDLLKGAEVLNGATGADTLIGGLGNDTYYVDSATDVVVELAGAGQGTADTIYASINLTLAQNVEKVVIVDTGAHAITGNGLSNVFQGNNGSDTLSGGGGNDTIDGGRGNDRLDGGAGQDSMKGGAGDDTYIVDNINDKVIETSNSAGGLLLPGSDDEPLAGIAGITDTVLAAINYTLATLQYVENLTLTGAASRATGNGLANGLVGNAGADTLDGGAGNDTLDGGAGTDRLIGGIGNDVLAWGTGDKLDGGAGTDTLKVTSGSLNLVPLGVTSIANVEIVDLRSGGNNTLTLNAQDVLDLSSTTNTVKVLGDAGDKVAAAGFTQIADLGGLNRYASGAAVLLVESDVTVVL